MELFYTLFFYSFCIACVYPTNNALLVNFRLSSDAENFVNKHRLSIQVGVKRAKMCLQCKHAPTELPFCTPPLVVGYIWRVDCTTAHTKKSLTVHKHQQGGPECNYHLPCTQQPLVVLAGWLAGWSNPIIFKGQWSRRQKESTHLQGGQKSILKK